MPFVKFTTTKTLTLQQEVSLKKVTGELISIFPNKSEEYLMVHIEDNQVMYFKGKEIECIRIVVELYRQCDMEYMSGTSMTGGIFDRPVDSSGKMRKLHRQFEIFSVNEVLP